MGANCCVAVKSSASVSGNGIEIYRNDRYSSPSWSFWRDSRTHIEDSVGSRSRFSHGNSGNIGSEIKSSIDTEAEGASDGESPLTSFPSTRWSKSPSFGMITGITSKGGERDLSIGSASSVEVGHEDIVKLTNNSGRQITKSFTFSPTSSMFRTDPSSSHGSSLPSDSAALKKAHGSSSYKMSRQTSDSQIPVLGSQNESIPANERHSFTHPNYAHNLSIGGSNGGSLGNWSMRMFSELGAPSQRERWSFDSDNSSSGYGKLSVSNHHQCPAPAAFQKCGICSKILKERSPFSGRKFVNNEIPVAAVMACGHVYHADCMEKVTSETERFDPPCPVCIHGGKNLSKLMAKLESKSKSKISRIAVANIELNNESAIDHRKGAEYEKEPKLGASSSMKSSWSKPFLKRHFSMGSSTSRPSLANEGTKKRGFWFSHR